MLRKVFLSETCRKFWVGKYLCDKFPVREQFWKKEMLSNIKEEFENIVLGTIFGRQKEEITGDGRQLHNENLHDSYLSYQINKIGMGEKYVPSWEKKSACSVLAGKPEGKRPLGTQSVDGSVMLVRVLELWDEGTFKWIHLSQPTDCRSVVNTAITYGFYDMWGISWLAEELLASLGLGSMS